MRFNKRENTHISMGDILRSNIRPLVFIGVIAVIVIIVIAIIVNSVSQSNFNSSFLVTGDTIKIGLRTDIEGFGQVEDNGDIAGFDRDFIDEALRRVLPGDQQKLVEYNKVSSQDAGASIKYEISNICLGLLVEDTDRTKGFRLSEPYYTDSVVAVVQGTSKLDKLANMEGGKIGVFSGALPADDVEKYLKRNKLEYDIQRYSDYESAMADIEYGRVHAVVMPYAIARQFETRGFRILAEPLYEVGYCAMLPTGQSAFTRELNKAIAEMEADGTMEELRRKWGLEVMRQQG